MSEVIYKKKTGLEMFEEQWRVQDVNMAPNSLQSEWAYAGC